MRGLNWWMRAVGIVYLLQAVVAGVVRLPIYVLGPPGTLDAARAGDGTALLLIDTWVLFALEVGTVGVVLLVASFRDVDARVLVWTVLALELFRGIGHDVYMLSRGYEPTGLLVWIVIHVSIIGSGLFLLRGAPGVVSRAGS
jgi:hypothetical protein